MNSRRGRRESMAPTAPPNENLEEGSERDFAQFGGDVTMVAYQNFAAENGNATSARKEVSPSFAEYGLRFGGGISLAPYRRFDAYIPNIFEWFADYVDKYLGIDESIDSHYNSLAQRCSFVLRQISSIVLYSDKSWESLCAKLSGLLAEMEAVAGELCPHKIPNIQQFAKFARQAAVFERDDAAPPESQGLAARQPVTSPPPRATPRTTKDTLPELPEGLAWPTETYAEAHNQTGERIVEFLERVWQPLIDAGFRELRWLRTVDLSAAQGVENYERVDPKTGEKRRLPQHLRLLTKKESNDLKLAGALSAIRDDPKLASTLATRLRRRAATPNA